MNNVLLSKQYQSVIVYLDDVLVYSNTKEKHRRASRVVQRLKDHNLYVGISECELETEGVKYLEYASKKVRSLEELPRSATEWEPTTLIHRIGTLLQTVDQGLQRKSQTTSGAVGGED